MNDQMQVLIEKYIGNKNVYKVSNKNTYLETIIPPEERSLTNMPKYSDGSPKVRFQDWLVLSKSPELYPKSKNANWGWSSNGRVFGWSSRAIGEFYKTKKIRRDTIGNDTGREYTVETDKEAEKLAKQFAKEVS